MKIWAGAATAGAIVLVAAPACAGDAACLWSHAPQAARDHLLSIPDQDGKLAGEDLAAVTVNVTAQGSGACGVTDANKGDAGLALVGYSLSQMAERWLKTHSTITRANLDAGWSGMSAATRNGLVEASAGQQLREPTDAEFAEFVTHMNVPGLDVAAAKADKRAWAIGIFIEGRSVATAFQAKF